VADVAKLPFDARFENQIFHIWPSQAQHAADEGPTVVRPAIAAAVKFIVSFFDLGVNLPAGAGRRKQPSPLRAAIVTEPQQRSYAELLRKAECGQVGEPSNG
jgi:hypothetical protein